MLYIVDRTISEWIELLNLYKKHVKSFPFLHAGSELETLFFKHMRIRACVQKFIRNLRMRIFRRREIGSTDLYTMSIIPTRAQVRVYDYLSKSVYIFHTQTAIRIIESGIQYSLWGIPSPHMPKNPYTNLPFNLQQLITIMEQIFVNCAYNHSLPPMNLIQFRQCDYKIDAYKFIHRHRLNMESAKSLLHSFHDPISVGFYMEVLNDTVTDEHLLMPQWEIIKKHVQERSLPEELQKRFDIVVLSLFLFQNHSICYIFKTYTDMLDELVTIYRASLQWWKHLPRRVIGLRRIGARAFTTSQNL